MPTKKRKHDEAPTNIPAKKFKGDPSLTSYTISDGITRIGMDAYAAGRNFHAFSVSAVAPEAF